MPTNDPHNRLRHHVTGAIERGEAEAIVGISQSSAYELRHEVARLVGEDRLPVDLLAQIVEEFGEKPEGAIDYELVVSVDGVFNDLRPFDIVDEAIDAVGEALAIKKAQPGAVVSLVVVESSQD